MSWKKYDIYSKSIDGIQVKTLGGGIITLVSTIIMVFLLLSEVIVWNTTEVVNHMSVDTQPEEIVDVELSVAFLHAVCNEVEMDISDNKGSNEIVLSNKIKSTSYGNGGCQFKGHAKLKKVSGEISFMHRGTPDLFNMMEFINFNSTHVVDLMRFGPLIPDMTTPLTNIHKTVMQNVAVYKYFLKIVPSSYTTNSGYKTSTFQYSVTEHTRVPKKGQITFPGVIFSYEFSPIRIDYVETKPTILQFLTSTSAIVGGIAAVAGILDRIYYGISTKKD